MKKKYFLLILMLILFNTTGCAKELKELKELQDDLDDIEYVYPDNKDVVVTLEEYNKLVSGMTEQEVWNIIGGECTNLSTTDLGIGQQYITSSYGCNGNGYVGSNVALIFQGGKLKSLAQIGLR